MAITCIAAAVPDDMDGSVDDDMVLMDITLYAPDQEQANYIKSKIQMNPTDFYCRVVDYIIENEEYVPSAAEEQGLF